MPKRKTAPAIRLRGVRHNNLKGFDLDLPLRQLIVVTGLSGSGKSSLAFDTLYAEGQRRYIETFSPYTRQFFDRMDKPQVDAIEGIPPAIAIEQRNAVKTTRSTVGTMTEINEHMKQVWPLLATLHCRQCGQPVVKETPQRVWALVRNADIPVAWPDAEFLITFDLPLSKKLSLKESLSLIEKQGYQRLLSRTGILPVHVEARARASTGDLVEAGEHALRETTTHEYRTAAACSKSGTMPVLRAQILRLEEATDHFGRQSPESLTVIQDRIRLDDGNRARFAEACEQAYHFGKGRLTVHRLGDRAADGSVALEHGQHFSRHFHCAGCDLEYREPTPALFSFNHPLGACPTCKGFGRVIQIDYNLALPDRSLTLAGGAVKPWRTGTGAESQKDMAKFCKARKIPMDVPFRELPEKIQRWVIDGDEGYGKDREHQWPRAWYGVKGYFRWLESKAYKMHVRVLLSKYRAYVLCGGCQGNRLQNEALLYRLILDNDPSKRNGKDGIDRPVASAMTSRLGSDESALPDAAAGGMTLPDFYRLPVRDALAVIDQLIARHRPKPNEPLGLVLGEVRNRLFYLSEIGLGYLTLDRPTRSLSGGETERVNLTSCLGSRLVNTLYVLDEPSVGLHPRDTARLVKILEGLRDAGNTVVVVEHEEGVMRAADQIVDLGPGHGESGGEVVFQGTFAQILRAKDTLTGEYLSGRRTIEVPERRPVAGQASSLAPASVSERADRKSVARGLSEKVDASAARLPKDDALFANGSMDGGTRSQSPGQAGSLSYLATLVVRNANKHNLHDLAVEIPLRRLVCITGVSGSGKTTLVRDVLLPVLAEKLGQQEELSAGRDKDADQEDNGGEGDEPNAGAGGPAEIHGYESVERLVLVDQSPIGRTPRSNPAVYIGAFDDIRELFAQTEQAKRLGFNASAFSFNSAQGQCDRCRGAGFEKIEMQFLSDVFIKCPACNGRRYREHILEVKLRPPGTSASSNPSGPIASTSPNDLSLAPSKGQGAGVRGKGKRSGAEPQAKITAGKSIADVLESSVDEIIEWLGEFAGSRPAERSVRKLKLLQEVGLGYLRLGQPINTLSGGECQRLKLVSHLANVEAAAAGSANQSAKSILFLFDEPTTGLHFEDVRVLLLALQRLVDAGHSVLVIEHHLDVIKCADWVIDLGPGAGDEGGQLVVAGTPEDVAACDASFTGQALRELVGKRRRK